MIRSLILVLVLELAATAANAQSCTWAQGRVRCLGDRNCDAVVTVADSTAAVNMSLDMGGEFCRPTNPACANDAAVAKFDLNCDYVISISELQTIVNNNLNGCFLPTFNGYNYPVGLQGNFCTHQIFVNNHCGNTFCQHANCPSCPEF